ncbi:Rha family transcriptional regulator [Methylobacterium sp. 22177]|uniref:Rha family transcriptional regulator n=1 Tax=Methylobacterium sp. 22177 TaxID=3453885 RepID=UPI003F844B88
MNALTPALMGAPVATPAVSEADVERFRLEVRDGVPRLDSRVIAERFEKRHSDVLRSVDLLIQRRPKLALRNFAEGSYTTPLTGRQLHRCYLVDRDGFALLVMGFTGDAALAWKLDYLEAFNRMEAMIWSRQAPALDVDDNQLLRRMLVSKIDEVDSLRAVAEAERRARIEAEDIASLSDQEMFDMGRALTVVTHRAEASAARVDSLQLKALAYDRISAARTSRVISEYAKDIRMQPKALFELLDSWDWIFQRGSRDVGSRKGRWVGGYRGLSRGYVEHDTGTVKTAAGTVESRQVMITAAGQKVIENMLAQGRLNLRRPIKA